MFSLPLEVNNLFLPPQESSFKNLSHFYSNPFEQHGAICHMNQSGRSPTARISKKLQPTSLQTNKCLMALYNGFTGVKQNILQEDSSLFQLLQQFIKVGDVPLGFLLHLLSDHIASKSNEAILEKHKEWAHGLLHQGGESSVIKFAFKTGF